MRWKILFLTVITLSLTSISLGFIDGNDLILEGSNEPTQLPNYATLEYGGNNVEGEIVYTGGDGLDLIEVECQGEMITRDNSPSAPYRFEIGVPETQFSHPNPCLSPDYQYSYDVTVVTGGGGSDSVTGFITLEANGDMDEHVGENMIVNLGITDGHSSPIQLRNFQITDDVWDHNDVSSTNSATVMVQNHAVGGSFFGENLFAVYELKPTASEHPSDNVLSFDDSNIYEWVERVESEEIRNDEVQIHEGADVLRESFTSGNTFEYGDVEGSSSWQISSQSPLHDEGNFQLDGEVTVGYYPHHYDEGGTLVDPEDGRRDSPDLYVCREGATMDNGFGDTVPQIVDVSDSVEEYDLLECNTDTGEWNNINRCNQEKIDTTGNGVLDGEPGGCEDPEPPGECEAGEAYYEDGMFYACYTDASGEIVNESYSEWGTDTQDWTEPSTDTFIGYEPNTALFPFEFSCDAGESCGRADDHSPSDWRSSWQTHGTMNYVEYVAWPNYLRWEYEDQSGNFLTDGAVWDSKFVSDTRGWTSRTQSLEEAEELYGGSQELDEAATWDAMNMTNTGNALASTIYWGDDAEEYSEAWTVANAGSDEEPILSDSPNFQGGWAGICGDDRWRYMTDDPTIDWMCDGEIYPPEGGSSGGSTFRYSYNSWF